MVFVFLFFGAIVSVFLDDSSSLLLEEEEDDELLLLLLNLVATLTFGAGGGDPLAETNFGGGAIENSLLVANGSSSLEELELEEDEDALEDDDEEEETEASESDSDSDSEDSEDDDDELSEDEEESEEDFNFLTSGLSISKALALFFIPFLTRNSYTEASDKVVEVVAVIFVLLEVLVIVD